jgi:hypothetical protein
VTNLEILGLSIGAFAATNMDDLFILIVFFANRSFPTSQAILGFAPWSQSGRVARCIGYTTQSSRSSRTISGIKEIIDLRNRENDDNYDHDIKIVNRLSKSRWKSYLRWLGCNYLSDF